LAGEELPFVFAKHVWENTLDKVKAVGQSVGFEKTTASLAEGQADKRMTQDLELLFN
jgi:hypothetical protein